MQLAAIVALKSCLAALSDPTLLQGQIFMQQLRLKNCLGLRGCMCCSFAMLKASRPLVTHADALLLLWCRRVLCGTFWGVPPIAVAK